MKTTEELIQKIYEKPFCRRCKKPLTEQEMEEFKQAKTLPLCKECQDVINDSLKKCLPLIQKLKLL